MSDTSLLERARTVLSDNWIGQASKPAPNLYPHQWSWDSAFVAIGNRHHRWDRAATEMATLFGAQWTNGLVPHIVFSDDNPGYFPSGSWWDSKASPHCPPTVMSSGIGQPAVHATAVKLVHRSSQDGVGDRFVEDLVPGLDAWHRYLHASRAIDGDLIEIWHPWESGRDNNPEWDKPMAAVRFDRSEIPPYRRADTQHAAVDDRPSDAEYDIYLYLVRELHRRGFDPVDATELQFRVRDILFNAVLVRAEHDLAELQELVGQDGQTARQRAGRLEQSIHEQLWSDSSGLYHSMDARTGELISTRTSGAFCALLLDELPVERRDRLIENLERDFLVPAGDGRVPLTVPVDEPGFEPGRYWRGPAWTHMSWLIAAGLDHQGATDLAEEVRVGTLALCEQIGFFEYFDPRRGSGHGTDHFSWSAALTVDLMSR